METAVYIMASCYQGKLYVGVTNNLVERVWQHKNNYRDGYTSRNRIYDLVFYEYIERFDEAIRRENLLKSSTREYKILLIERSNQSWNDLAHEL